MILLVVQSNANLEGHYFSIQARDFEQRRLVEESKLEEAQLAEEAALALAEVEWQKTMAALEAAKMQQRLAQIQTQKIKYIEMQAKQKRAVDALAHNKVLCKIYSIDEIEKATDYFNSSMKIGEGGYGPVYKGLLDHTAVAIKILRPDLSQGQQQFQREVITFLFFLLENWILQIIKFLQFSFVWVNF